MTVLAAWGTPENLAAAPWTATNVTVVGGSFVDPFAELNAFLVSDTSGAASGQLARSITLPARGTEQVLTLFYAAGSAGSCRVIVIDTTATVQRANAVVTSAGVVTASVGRAGVFNAGVALGRQWWGLVIEASGLVPTNAHALEIYPDASGPAGTGSSYIYLRPTWTHGWPLDNASAFPLARAGSVQARSLAGVRDTWLTGTDEMLTGTLRYIPRLMQPDPACSGYEGDGDGLIGVGFRALMRAGREARTIRWVRDRSACAQFVDGELVAPFEAPSQSLEPDGSRSVAIELMGTTPYRGAD